ncbi:sensor domain-containing diguanylate cyclase [Shewanella algae]|uniref:sensor domain-containing diguanylate cyclase n=1 Tax=Shewanella algae TaxID=38313 RepID=UPI001AAC5DDE|nr:sensor domain-containing diguanylate cyclase [Shewanella algae]MBO2685150.1 GGDEF domain-containing protein [Shewanella algae]BCV63962.1 diguanylate cyclase [Shewanella algae]
MASPYSNEAGFSQCECDSEALATLIECMQQPMVLADGEGKVLAVNSPAAELLGDQSETFAGEFWHTWLAAPYRSRYASMFGSQYGRQVPLQHGPWEVLLRRVDGVELPVNLSLSFIQGLLPLFVIGLHDLSGHRDEIKRLSTLAATDYLTGLANRRTFTETLERQWQQCVDKHKPISTLIIDADHFKQFNDQHGHLMGDECLKLMAKTIAAALPSPQCLAARFGGEEFALVLPGFNSAMAWVVAEQIAEAIRSLDFVKLGLSREVCVSVSQGIATEINGQYRTAEAMLSAADTALYRAKSDGRDRIKLSA